MLSKRTRGFGIVEILVTLGILTVGILGVTKLHSVVTQQSLENKAKQEALVIAQSRIDTLRNYTGLVSTQAAFDSTYANVSAGNSTPVHGVNAEFTRTETITTDTNGTGKNVAVAVAWSDSDGESQSVTLTTRLSYISPRSQGDTALSSATGAVASPTGRARLGDGTLPQNAVTTTNGDGTALYRDGSTELRLTSGSNIVLTLSQACVVSTGVCEDFVKIKGRVYIDTSTQSSLVPGRVFVVASDAAFCARYYTSGGTTTVVNATTTTVLTTANGNYKYFDYTCYLGGGWQGNIGIVLGTGNSGTDKFCMGDPTSNVLYSDPIVAARRVYRGMIYKYKTQANGGVAYNNTYVEPVTGSNLERFYSKGIADSTELPVPNSGQKTHDYVVSGGSSTVCGTALSGSSVVSGAMTRTDSAVSGTTGALFSGMPTDFVCLNSGYLDTYDTALFGHKTTCPFNPSSPPSSRHAITGNIRLTTTQSTANAAMATAMFALTSDGPDNCTISSAAAWNASGYYQSSYSCDIYDWGNGWNGSIDVTFPSANAAAMTCTTSRLSFSAVTAATTSTGTDFTTCTTGTYAVISGTVNASGNRKLSTATMSNGGTCSVATSQLSYTCTSAALQGGATWSGTLTVTATSGVMCNVTVGSGGGGSSPKVYTFSNLAGSTTTTQNLRTANNNGGC
jgi:Tfp pilus assembly protein PilV